MFCSFFFFLFFFITSFFFLFFFFFFNDTATTEIYTLSLHDALPIFRLPGQPQTRQAPAALFALTRRDTTTASRTAYFRRQGPTVLALSQMRWTNESHPTVHRCRTPTSFSTDGLRCRMKHSLQPENPTRCDARTTSLSRCQTDPFLRPLQLQPGQYSFVLAI